MLSSTLQSLLEDQQQLELNQLIDSLQRMETRIVSIGLYNHGKSSLNNVLVGDLHNKTFKVADIRETRDIKAVQVNDRMYVDTPGLNANKQDEEIVNQEAKTADIILFVHNITTGELSKKEVDALHQLKSNYADPQDFINKTYFVITRIDRVENKQDIQECINKIQQQIRTIFNTHYGKIISVSATQYAKGLRENKSLLVEKSNIPLLQESLEQLINDSQESIKQTKLTRLENMFEQLNHAIETKIKNKQTQLNQFHEKSNKMKMQFEQDIKQIEQILTAKYESLA